MSKSIKIGLTGGIASGKTTVSNFFKQFGTEVIDADVISHQVTKPDGTAFQEIISSFGSSVLDENGLIDRKKMRAIIFDDVAVICRPGHPSRANEVHTISERLKEDFEIKL